MNSMYKPKRHFRKELGHNFRVVDHVRIYTKTEMGKALIRGKNITSRTNTKNEGTVLQGFHHIHLLLQGTPDYIVVVELAYGPDPLAPGATFEGVISTAILVSGQHTNTGTATGDHLGGTATDSDDANAYVINPATRTLGFWKTHYDYTMHVFNVHLGGSIDLGWVTIDSEDSEEELFGMFYANVARDANGDKRDALNKARVKASHQALAAILNTGLTNGAPPDGFTVAGIAAILGGEDIDAINSLHNTLDIYNNSYDDAEIEDIDGYSIQKADPKAAKDAADITIADN